MRVCDVVLAGSERLGQFALGLGESMIVSLSGADQLAIAGPCNVPDCRQFGIYSPNYCLALRHLRAVDHSSR